MTSIPSSSTPSTSSTSTPTTTSGMLLGGKPDSREKQKEQSEKDPQIANIVAAKAVSDAVRTSLGPRGMDKMIIGTGDSILITNDGATILKQLEVTHPTAKMLVELSKSQDIEAGDGTTSVVVICGALLNACKKLLLQGIHPTLISDAFGVCGDKASEILEKMAIPLDISDKESLIKSAMTSLSSKVVSQYADKLGPLSVDAVMAVLPSSFTPTPQKQSTSTTTSINAISDALSKDDTINTTNTMSTITQPTATTTTTTITTSTTTTDDSTEISNLSATIPDSISTTAPTTTNTIPTTSSGSSSSSSSNLTNKQPIELPTNVDINDIKIVKKLGGTLDDTELVDGIVFTHGACRSAGGPTRKQVAKIALIQFHLSPPKTDMDNNVIINDSSQIDRILREERSYLLQLCQKIKKTGCNVLLIQKSILRDATTDMSLHFLAKMGIMVVQDIERTDIEFISKTLNCKPIAHIDSFKPEKFGYADIVEEINLGSSGGEESGRIVKVTGIKNKGRTVTILCRASNKLVLDEAERSIHDALCVIRSLIKKKFLIAGGGAPEIELSIQLAKYANQLKGIQSVVCRAFADALEIIPTTLAENAGLKPIQIVTELRNRHSNGESNTGISVKKGLIKDMVKENVVQPLLVSTSAIQLATETVRMILKIDRIVDAR